MQRQVINMPTKSYLRSNFHNRQENDVTYLNKLFDEGIMTPYQETKGLSAKALSERFGVSVTILDQFTRRLENAGIISRRLEYGGGTGRKSYWRLNCEKEEAIEKLTTYHNNEAQRINHPPNSRGSLKVRILEAMKAHNGVFESPRDIALAIKQGNEIVSVQRVSQALGSLKDEGKISFRRDTSGRHHNNGVGKHGKNDNVPYDIRLMRPEAITKVSAATMPSPNSVISVDKPKHSVGTDMTDFRNQPRVAEGGPIERILPIVAPTPLAEQYPLIAKMASRSAVLESAAMLAESAGEDEIALALYEKAKTETSEFNTEVLRLWEAFKECKDNGY